MNVKKTVLSVLYFMVMFCAFLFTDGAAAKDMFKITLIDVGKGDCILVQTGNEEEPYTVMIDTGYKETANDVIKYLGTHHIEKLDVLIISHFHKDHVGGAAAILKEIPVGIVYMPDYESTKKVYEEMMAVLSESGGKIPYQRLTDNVSFSLGAAEYRIYPSRIAFDGGNDNDVSMAATLEYDGHTALFAGDLEKDGIEQLLKNNEIPAKHYDILKLPHHGSDEKNTKDLLQRLKDHGIAVITDGQDRRAHGTLLDKMENDGFEIYCSADAGTIVISANGTGYAVEKSTDPDYETFGDWKYIVRDDGSAAITGYTGKDTEITLPAEIGGHPVRSVADSAFYNHKDLKHVMIPEGVESVGNSAFSWCTGMIGVTIPTSVTSIGNAAFSFCTSLERVTVPDSVKSIGKSGFEHCTALKNVILSNGLTEVAPSLLERCESLESIHIPDGVKTIGKDSFKRCIKLTEVSIPESVTLIDEEAFKRCESLEKIDIPEGVKTIEESAFERCISLKLIKIPDSVTSLEKAAFQNCVSLESAEIGKGVKTLKKSAFSGCAVLRSVIIPGSVESVKGDVFRDCGSLKEIRYGGTSEQWEAVSKDKDWDKGTPADMEVICSDPEVDPDPDPDVPDPQPEIRFFRMPELPATGVSSEQPRMLSVPAEDLRYDPSGSILQIPSLDVAGMIVSVPFRDGEYPVERLGSNIGLPEEFAVPGSGPAILVGHNHLGPAEAGPFALLAMLAENSRIMVTDRDDHLFLFSVFANTKIAADDMAAVENLWSAYENSLILITCEDERPEGGYASRRIIAAKPVTIQGN